MTDRFSETLPFGTKILLNGKYRTFLRDYTGNQKDRHPVWVSYFPAKEVSKMQEKYNVTGMTCAACQARVQKSVSNLTGVQECNVNLLKNSMVVTYDDKNVNSGQIIAAVEKAGYGASIQQVKGKSAAQAVSPVDTVKKEYETMKRRVIWSFVFTIPLFYISMGHMMGWPLPGFFLGTENSMIYALTLFLLALPVAIINNKYYRMGFKTLFHGSPNMDSLIALGSGASLAYGVYALYKTAWGFGYGDLAMVNQFTHDLYFEGAGTILTLITLGKFFEARAKGRTSDAINKLMNLAPKKATVVRNGVETVIPAEEVEKGDILIVKAGESVPVDGVLLEGTGSLDESAITGESIPVDKQAGDKVIGATINQSGYFRMRADKVGDETALSQIIKLVDEATSSKAPIAKLAYKVAGIFVPIVIGIALLAGTMSSMKQKQFHQRRLYGCADFQNIVILKYELGLKVAKLLAWFPFRNY